MPSPERKNKCQQQQTTESAATAVRGCIIKRVTGVILNHLAGNWKNHLF